MRTTILTLGLFVLSSGQSVLAQPAPAAISPPAAAEALARPTASVRWTAPPLDLDAIRAEDEARATEGLPYRYAIPCVAAISPSRDGTWENLGPDTRVWRLEVAAPGAVSLNFRFARYQMPTGGELRVYAADGCQALRAFTAADNEEHGELWTPAVLTDDVIIEVVVPQSLQGQFRLELAAVNVGYRGFGELLGERSGACNVDVVCPEGDGWRPQIRSVAVISIDGALCCTGALVNNTAQDRRPYFLTAYHCGLRAENAASLVVYWNFQSPTCGQHGGGTLDQSQSGSYFRAGWANSDFTLVELDDDPDPVSQVVFAGWDRSGTAPTSAVCIHHPNCDEKSISFEYDACQITSYYGYFPPGNGTHIRVPDWDVGTTEPGSSGSPLFNQDGRIVGQLHGGDAACDNDFSDWFGRFFVSWTGGGASDTRLSDWLDPGQTGLESLDSSEPVVWVDFSYVGTERGTFAEPYNTLIEGVSAAPLGGDVSIKAGSSPETLTITKALTIYAYDGSVSIGQ